MGHTEILGNTIAGEQERRKEFLRLGTGAGLAASVLLVGKTPALASARDITPEAHAWARLNKDKLPQAYEDFAQYPLAYRRAIFAELPAAQRSNLWCEHLASYRASKGAGLSQDQEQVLDSAMRLARDHAGGSDPGWPSPWRPQRGGAHRLWGRRGSRAAGHAWPGPG